MMRQVKAALLSAGCLLSAAAADAHPHVFVDGGVDFVMADGAKLEALEVTWLYDPFETLYILAALKISPDADWRLTEEDRARLIAHESAWGGGFDGTSHLSVRGADVDLARPTSFDVDMRGDQLQVSFRRDLPEPIDLSLSRVLKPG